MSSNNGAHVQSIILKSWWLRWQAWVTPYAGEQVPARALGNAQYPTIEAAPGRYVLVNLF